MLRNYTLDRCALDRDPNLADFDSHFDAGAHTPAFENEVGQRIYQLLTSRVGVAMLIGAIASASSRPPVVGIEPLLFAQIGEEAFEDNMKRMTGRLVRYIIEYVGGRYETRGVKVTKTLNSHYASGAIYSFPEDIRR